MFECAPNSHENPGKPNPIETARFWTSISGTAVKLSIRDGESFSIQYGGPTEEGYSYTNETYTRHGSTIACEIDNTARDCDGQFDSHGESMCFLDRLAVRKGYYTEYHDGRVILYPDWNHVSSGQRDYSAERAGY